MPLDANPSRPESQTIPVVAGGIAGISAALEAAETGHKDAALHRNTLEAPKLAAMAKK